VKLEFILSQFKPNPKAGRPSCSRSIGPCGNSFRRKNQNGVGTFAFGVGCDGPRQNDSKRHVISDGQGIPLALIHTGANVHDSQAAMPLVDSIPSIKRPGGGRRRRPDSLYADRAYDAEDKIRKPLRQRRITPRIASRNSKHGSGLGKHRSMIESASPGCSSNGAPGFVMRKGVTFIRLL
jgi:transposase